MIKQTGTNAPTGTAATGANVAPIDPKAAEKEAVAEQASEQFVSGTPGRPAVIGLGTGSTAKFLVADLGEQLAAGKVHDIVAVSSSVRTAEQARGLGIPLSDLDSHARVAIYFD